MVKGFQFFFASGFNELSSWLIKCVDIKIIINLLNEGKEKHERKTKLSYKGLLKARR